VILDFRFCGCGAEETSYFSPSLAGFWILDFPLPKIRGLQIDDYIF